jgi:hypothetical protein
VTYSGPAPELGLALELAETWRLAFAAEYAPALSIDESPTESGGDPSANSLLLAARLDHRLAGPLGLGLSYSRQAVRAQFDGAGDRSGGIQDAETADITQDIRLSLTLVF